MNLKKVFAVALAGTMAVSAVLVPMAVRAAAVSEADSDAGIEFVINRDEEIYNPIPQPTDPSDPDATVPRPTDPESGEPVIPTDPEDPWYNYLNAHNIFFGIRDILSFDNVEYGVVEFSTLETMAQREDLTAEISDGRRFIHLGVFAHDSELRVERTFFNRGADPFAFTEDFSTALRLNLPVDEVTHIAGPGSVVFAPAFTAVPLVTRTQALVMTPSGAIDAQIDFYGELSILAADAMVGEEQTVVTWELVAPVTVG